MALPTVTDILALPELQLGAPVVVGGRTGLSREVRWVHVSELGDIAHLLTGGELLLTTGIALDPTPAGLADYVLSLADVQAAGVVLEAGRRFSSVPEAMAEAADRLGLPVILLRRQIRFVRVTQEAHSFIIDTQLAELQARREIDQIFTELAVEGASVKEIMAQAARMAGSPVLLVGRSHQVLAVDGGPLTSEAVLASWRAAADRVAPGRRDQRPVQAMGWVVAPVGARGDSWGLLAMMNTSAAWSDRSRAVLDRAAMALALNRLADRDRESLELQAQRLFLSEILAGGQPAAALGPRAEALGLPQSGRAFVAGCVRPLEPVPKVPGLRGEALGKEIAHLVAAVARQQRIDCLVGVTAPQRVSLVLSIPHRLPLDPVLMRLSQAMHGTLLAHGTGDALIAFGSRVAEMGGIRRSLAEAEQVLSALGDPAPKPFYRLPDIRLRGLLHLLRQDQRVESFCERELGPLLAADPDGRGQLLVTLRTYLEAAGNKSHAATRLGVSRPTVYSRLDRVKQLLGVNLDSPESRLSLQVAVLALEELRRDEEASPR